MSRRGISRRDCLALLGAGAAAAITPAVAESGQTTAKTPAEESSRRGGKVAIQSEMEELKELSAQRAYAPTPVQSRPEYAAASQSGGGGWQMHLREGWELLGAEDTLAPGHYPSDGNWIKTQMPRPVHYALMESGQIPNLWYGDNFKELQWIQKRDWYLRRQFTIPESWRDSVIRLRFDGMDYLGLVWLDGEFLGGHEGSFGGPTFDITTRVIPGKTHELLVRLVHEPHDQIPNYDSSSENRNPRVVKPDAQDGESYQWGNRYRTFGLYQPIRIVATGPAYMEAPFVRTDTIGSEAATLWAQAMLTNTGTAAFEGLIDAQIVDLSNQQVVWQAKFRQKVPAGNSFWEQEIELKQPKLWWPNGMGEQPLYRLELKLFKEGTQQDFISSRFGVRTLQLKRNPSNPDSPRAVPSDKTLEDEAYMYLWVANGRPFYAKGSCWMTSDDVLWLPSEREEWMVRAAKLSGQNLLRLNGGTSIFETEQFYNLCDENGMIVWQEVPLNWADTPGTTTLAVWREQLTQNVLRIRQHPSIGIYCGGNEYDPFQDGIEPFLGLVREVFAGYDGSRPFRMNSPCGGDYHAYEPQEIYTADENWYHKLFDRGHYFISEWSFSSFANLSLLKRIIPPAELEMKPVGYDVEKFKRRFATIRDRSAEINYTFVKSWQRASWYGDFAKADLEQLIECSQMAYEHNIGCVLEQWRAQFPHTGGETLWTYNSLGPIANSWHLIDWCGQPQIPFYATQRANEPVHVMADTGFFSWGPGDTFRASVFALNDREQVLKGGHFSARIYDQQLRVVHEEEWASDVPANGYASQGHDVHWPIPANTSEGYLFFELTLRDAQGSRLSRRAYWLRIVPMLADPQARKIWQAGPVPEPLNQTGPWLKPQIEALTTSLQAAVKIENQSQKEAELRIDIENQGKIPAYPVRIHLFPDVYSVLWTDDYFWLAPGEKVSLRGIVRLDMNGLDPIGRPPIANPRDLRIRLSAWNAPATELRPR
ncbi:MAG: sugar-binding domain-containing protein [Terriglobales bacterium]